MNDFPSPTTELTGKRVTVMGLGRFGGGVGVMRFLIDQGARITLTDRESETSLRRSLDQLAQHIDLDRIELRLGEHLERDFAETDLVIANPAVPRPWENPYLQAAREHGVPISTAIRLLIERIDRQRTIGVTGSAGKSTTAAMIHHLLREAGLRSHLGGNIGGSLLPELHAIQPEDWIVLELSSAQLYWLGEGVGYDSAPGWSPHVSVLTNLAPNHLDWHGSVEHYRTSKQNIFRHQQPGDHQITEALYGLRQPLPLSIPGEHNQKNGFYAMLAVFRAMEIPPHESAPRLASFRGLPHRLQRLEMDDPAGRAFFDDSKSTTPDATALAMSAFKRPSRVHLIVGGYDKGVDLTPIAQRAPKLAGMYTIGETGETLAERAEAAVDEARQAADRSPGAPPRDLPRAEIVRCGTLDRAVEQAMARMLPEHILLLSPGCASWDQFTNYEQRGTRFAELVQKQIELTGASTTGADGANP